MGNTPTKNVNYAIPIYNEDRKENETFIYRSPDFANIGPDNYEMEFATLHELYNKYFSENPHDNAMGHRLNNEDGTLANVFTWLSKTEIKERCEELASGMVNLDLFNTNKEWNGFEMKMIAIYSKNSVNYLISDMAMAMQGITCVPIYDTLGEEATEFIFNQTKIRTCFVTSNHVEKLLKSQKEKKKFKYLKTLVVLDPENLDKELVKENNSFKVLTFEDVMESGRAQMRPWANVTPETAYCISYTSGTTGVPKGAVLTHKNLLSVFGAVHSRVELGRDDIHISYLPLAHIFERAVYNICLSRNVKIGVFNGNVLKLKEDLGILKPTMFISVPRLFNKFYDTIKGGINQATGLKRKLVDMAVDTKLKNLKESCSYTHGFYDTIVFKKMKNVLGGRVKFMVTASAPISLEVLNFLKICFSCPILEAYGQTEGTGGEFVTYSYDPQGGHVGGPAPQNEFKLVDVEEMQYTSKDVDEKGRPSPRGEIWVRGPNIIPGYFLNDAKNKETFTKDGWLLSGDIGQILADGNRLKIIDRKKNIFKLSQGEYIAPEKLEGAYKVSNPLIADVFVYGDSLKSCLIGVVNIEKANIVALAKELGVEGDADSLPENEEFKKKVIEMFNAEAKKRNYNKLEMLKKIKIETTLFIELGLCTTTFKKKRNDFKKHYQNDIDALYQGLY